MYNQVSKPASSRMQRATLYQSTVSGTTGHKVHARFVFHAGAQVKGAAGALKLCELWRKERMMSFLQYLRHPE
jgi:hypothetical protein